MARARRGKKKIGRCKRKNKQRFNTEEPEELKNAPHSFVFHRGNVGENIIALTQDFRRVMQPFTASSLKVKKTNKMKDFLAVSGLLHVSHICVFTSTNVGTYLRIGRLPRGPTLCFKVLNYSLARDVVSNLKKQLVFQEQFQHPPLIILNNFSGEELSLQLMTSMFQNMFPSLNLTKVNLNNVRRCALLNYNAEIDEIDFRHYSIKVVPVDISKGVKKMIQNKVPNLSKFEDPAEIIMRAEMLSESEAEDDPNAHVTLPQKISTRGNAAASRSAIRLVEQGPRMTLQLVKIEEGFASGEVLYHKLVVKTEEEKEKILKMRVEKTRIREMRKKEQQIRKSRKESQKQQQKEKSLKGMKKQTEEGEPVPEDDDVEWFTKEVGHEPDRDLFTQKPKNKEKRKTDDFTENKKRKKDQEVDNGKGLTKNRKKQKSK